MHQYGNLTDGALNPVINSITYNNSVSNNQTVSGVITFTFTCDLGDIGTYTPAPSSGYCPTWATTLYGIEANTAYQLTDFKQEPIPGTLCKVTLSYTSTYTSLPDATVVEQSTSMEVSIQEHPSFSSWSSQWDFSKGEFFPTAVVDGVSMYGTTSYVSGSTNVIVTQYYDSQPADNKANIGCLQSPGGSYGDAANWLIISSVRQQQNNFWVLVTTYQYSPQGWNPNIYSNAT